MGNAPTVTTLPWYSMPLGVVVSPLVFYKLERPDSKLYLQHPRAATKEVTRIVVSMESNQVAMENAYKNVVAYRKDAVDLAAGEWGVQEESDLDVGLLVVDFFAKHRR